MNVCLWLLLLIIFAYQVPEITSSIISQSSISTCEAGNDKEPTTSEGGLCKKKILVSMALSGGQGETESLYANIDQAYQEDETELSRLRRPFRIEISKTEVVSNYRVHYVGSANGKPSETYFHKKDCNDAWHSETHDLACGAQVDASGDRVWDSQGFCCRCNSLNQRYINRAELDCTNWLFTGSTGWGSAHCMTMSSLWYNVFTIDPPSLQYNITVRILQFNGVNKTAGSLTADWSLLSTFNLNPTRTLGRSLNGRVFGEIQGDLLGAQGPRDFSYKYLLIPSLTHWTGESPPDQYVNGSVDWLMVDRHLVDLSGTECGKIGVSYSGFRRQQGRCDGFNGSCFYNQPIDLWEVDYYRLRNNKTARFLLSSFGKIHPSTNATNTSFILRFLLEDLHNTFVSLRIDASDIVFVYNVGSGRIVDVYALDFEALSDSGKIVVDVENTGDVTAEFSLSVLNCGNGIHTVRARVLNLDPGQIQKSEFRVESYRATGENYVCDVHLYDSDYNLIQTATVNFRTNSTCFCFGSCGCSCDSEDGFSVECPKPPTIEIHAASLFVRIFFLILEAIGLQGIVGTFGGLFLIFGFIKLAFGKILFCRQTKAQQFAKELKKQGILEGTGPTLVKCSGQCRGALASKERFKRKVMRLKEMGKKPNRLDDWRNYSYSCTCQNELTDIKFVEILKSVFFFYYCCILPCVWLGKKVIWGVFRDTEKQKAKATKAVLEKARKKGNLGKYDFDITEQVKELYREPEDDKKSKKNKEKTKKNKRTSNTKEGKEEESDAEKFGKFDKRDNKSAGIVRSGSDSKGSINEDSYHSITDTDEDMEPYDNSGKEDLVSEQ
ncbi:PREDICTED: protein HAPLESS 2-A-like [Amphimedon queenslandica]|uniref:Generative cell specific-1/HAP2 domain-containing protein n=1 Tax=Amphimedon queenslandica TaxID=400682 RepID=A0AAN0JDF0_AMPQE|nr:PREDICTED: protein HAPLESS 2-A-like [Amphimedon queenslandica]|eukprot:XP_019855024.1 PREDICTED: protein HAPLESS 2-A-like [Amphimedon queenslandica]